MTTVVFVGPTLWSDDPATFLEAEYRPPAGQGDVLKAALRADTTVIGVVDGYFESVPAVWHKEVLWAMSHGIHVFGAASMGALRAAELSAFGMHGIGSIYRAYASGELEDDDEVALAHAPIDFGYQPISEPMVNVRATARAAEAAGVISSGTHVAVVRSAKELFYQRRIYSNILADALEIGADAHELQHFRTFIDTNRVDQKRADALEMLHTIGELTTSGVEPMRVAYELQASPHLSRALVEQGWTEDAAHPESAR